MLICPKCKKKLFQVDNTYKCVNNHSYDIAKSGYLNLLLSRFNAGDSKEMLIARDNFLKQDFYLPIARNILTKISHNTPLVVDCGCGTGYYTNYLAQNISSVFIGIDISKTAVDFAAKKNKKVLYVVASNSKIPLADHSVDVLLNIFAPYGDTEFARIISPTGRLITVSANPHHLHELKELVYSIPHTNMDKVYFLPSFHMLSENVVEYTMILTQNDILNLFKMTPYYYKTKTSDFEKLFTIDQLEVTASFLIKEYQKKN